MPIDDVILGFNNIAGKAIKLGDTLRVIHLNSEDEANISVALRKINKELDDVTKLSQKYVKASAVPKHLSDEHVQYLKTAEKSTIHSQLLRTPSNSIIPRQSINEGTDVDEVDISSAERFFNDNLIPDSDLELIEPPNTSNNQGCDYDDFDNDEGINDAILKEVAAAEDSFFNDSHTEEMIPEVHKGQDDDDDATDPLSEVAQDDIDDDVLTEDDNQPSSNYLLILRKYFGHKSFRPLQWKIVNAILNEKRDVCVVMSTGYGKSVCYQYPSVFTGRLSVVVSPLISLMVDQVMALRSVNIPANYLGSAQDSGGQVRQDALNGKYRVLYLTPEFISTAGCQFLQELDNKIGLDLVAIDEAHCVTVWGHDFRHSYRALKVIRENLPKVPIMALTATATPQVEKDICQVLKLRNPLLTRTGFDRPNLFLTVESKSNSAWSDLKTKMVKVNDKFEFDGATIIYCPTIKVADELTAMLQAQGITAGAYHSKLGNKMKQETHNKFLNDQLQVVVATVAFGMGIDKSDIRRVIHYGAPKDIESYYQEIGRAGRDGQPATCHVFFNDTDFQTIRFLLSKDTKAGSYLQHRLSMLHKLESDYLKSSQCRRRTILRHFEDPAASAVGMTYNCCDNCRKKLASKEAGIEETAVEKMDVGKEALDLLTVIETLNGQTGMGIYIMYLMGSTSDKMSWIAPHHQKNPLFGKYKSEGTRKKTWLQALGKLLLKDGYLKQESRGRNTFGFLVNLAGKGQGWLAQQRHVPQPSLMVTPSDDMVVKVKQRPAVVKVGGSEPISAAILGSVATGKWLSSGDWKQRTGQTNSQTVQPSAEETQHIKDLLSLLMKSRDKLAGDRGLHAVNIFTNKILQDMAKYRPSSVENMLKLDSIATERVQLYGDEFIKDIKKFCDDHGLAQDCFPKPVSVKLVLSASMEKILGTLSMTERQTYELFELENMSLGLTATQRGVQTSTIVTQLCKAIAAGLPVDIERLGVTNSIKKTIEEAIRRHPNNAQITRLTQIKDQCPDHITFDQIKIVREILALTYGTSEGVLIPSSHLKVQTEEPLPSQATVIKVQDYLAPDGTLKNLSSIGSFQPMAQGSGQVLNRQPLTSAMTTDSKPLTEQGDHVTVGLNISSKRPLPSTLQCSDVEKQKTTKKLKTNSLFTR